MIALASATLAALWLPQGAPDVAALEALLARRPELRLAVAMAPEDLPALSTAALARLWSEGRVEPVLRLSGDPILPLAPMTRRELRPLLSLGRQAFLRSLGRPAEGFAPGGGLADEALLKSLESLGFRWAASRLPRAETLEAVEALAIGASTAAAGTPDDLSPWTKLPDQKKVAARLEEAAAAVERYQNSGTAQLEVLDAASALLRRLEASRYLAQPGLAAEFEAGLTEVYAALGQRPPEELVASTEAVRAAGLVALSAGPGRMRFENAAPPLDSPVPGPARPGESFRTRPCAIESLEVSFDTAAVLFAVTLASSGWPAGGSVDIYIDINHRPGAGSQALLPWSEGFLRASDSWEFALSVSTAGAILFRGQASDLFPVAWEPEARRAAAAVPASRLRGKPGYWGYFAACGCSEKLAACALEPERRPWSVLGSRDEQRQLDVKKARQPRFSAQRLDPARAASTLR